MHAGVRTFTWRSMCSKLEQSSIGSNVCFQTSNLLLAESGPSSVAKRLSGHLKVNHTSLHWLLQRPESSWPIRLILHQSLSEQLFTSTRYHVYPHNNRSIVTLSIHACVIFSLKYNQRPTYFNSRYRAGTYANAVTTNVNSFATSPPSPTSLARGPTNHV